MVRHNVLKMNVPCSSVYRHHQEPLLGLVTSTGQIQLLKFASQDGSKSLELIHTTLNRDPKMSMDFPPPLNLSLDWSNRLAQTGYQNTDGFVNLDRLLTAALIAHPK